MSIPENKKTVGGLLNGFSWNVAGNFTRSVAGFAINIALARLLGPEPFGVVALAMLVIGIGNLVIESGLGSALIQKSEIGREDVAFVFTLQMSLGAGLALAIVAAAPWLAVQFDSPGAAPVLQAMASILVLQAFAQVPSALLRRVQNFKIIQIAQIISFFAGFLCLGLPMAIGGYGVWSLVAAQVVQSGLNALIVYYFSRHALALNLRGSRQLMLFGMSVLFANVANWIIQNVDNLIIGRRFGATNLGFYSRAYFLSWTPIGVIISSAQASLFSAVSRLGRGPETARIFLSFMSAFAIFFFSIYWLIALESTNIITIIYGRDWLPAAALLAPVAVAMPFLALVGLEGPVLNGLGKPQYEMWAQWVTAIFAIIVLLAASTVSLVAAAWSIVLIYLFRLGILSYLTIRVLDVSWFQLARPLLSGVLMGLLTALVWSGANYFIPANTALIMVSLARGLAAALAWLLVFWLGRKWLLPEFAWLLIYLRKRQAG